ncbi:class I SAM-dependent methyltransferase [Mesorhizobium sp. YC-39]|uniref:class I SAM-dependent methyltransferase n=1 Tax=unclassified Mesorhizobium TaxID=325217 RepID=UPI0021E713C1|nr:MULTISPECIES: class I SAM-dependent methyltransferase [unclassified Mesorhizobium]MCV3209931.1 class I SAM-dependent methyltransferase [Mesorhizobium sp. YC-2]MCV3230461.1 class I SAM-dependent methyltransferase [Mesorhizobium sp. YC-39]
MQTDIDEWRSVAVGTQPNWEFRAGIIAKLIRATDTVLDIGAGDQKLKKFISPACTYIPVDCVDDLPGTFVVDFNKEFRLPNVPFNVVVCAGSLEYINDLAGFFRALAAHAPDRQVIFTYFLNPAKWRRAGMKIHNNFATGDALLSHINFALSHVDIVAARGDTIFVSATLSAGGGVQWINDRPITDFLFTERGIKKFMAKTARSVRKRRNAIGRMLK